MSEETGDKAKWFLTTHWSVVRAAGGDSSVARDAWERLCQTYWYPLYAYVRRSGRNAHDAEDLVQGFFLHCVEKNAFIVADPAKGRFRSFMLTLFKRYAAKEWEKATARKRGGGCPLIELDAMATEERYALEPTDIASADKLYDRRWALTLLERTLAAMEREQAGNAESFALLKSHLTGMGGGLPHLEIAERLGMKDGAVRVAIHRLRARYRELLEREIAHTVGGLDDVKEERQYLLAALAG